MSLKFLQEISSGTKNAYLKKDIICYYINNGENTLADLGKEMNLSVPTVTKLVSELMDDGFVLDFGKQESNGGRRPSIYGLNENSGYFVGVDIKIFYINIGIVNFKGEMVDYRNNRHRKYSNKEAETKQRKGGDDFSEVGILDWRMGFVMNRNNSMVVVRCMTMCIVGFWCAFWFAKHYSLHHPEHTGCIDEKPHNGNPRGPLKYVSCISTV